MEITQNDKLNRLNGILIACFLFQYSLLIPVMGYINPTILVAVAGLLIDFLVLLYNYRKNLNMKVILFAVLMVLVLSLKSLIDAEGDMTILFYFSAIAGPAVIVFLYDFDRTTFFDWGYKLAIINFVINCLGPVLPNYSYMRFGYGMTVTVIFLYIQIRRFPKRPKLVLTVDLAIMTITIFEILMYGARGAFFVLLLFFALDIFFVQHKKTFRNFFLLGIGAILYLNLLPIILAFESFSHKVGVYSYSITKFRIQLVQGWVSSDSGRSYYYRAAIEKIKRRPVFGNPIDLGIDEGDYVHNIFLQVGQDLGLIALGVLVAFLVFVLLKLLNQNVVSEDKMMLTVFLSVSVGRLLFSSTLWKRPEFWMLVCFALSMKGALSNSDYTNAQRNKIYCSEKTTQENI